MNAKIPISKLGSLIAEKTGCETSDAIQFIKDLFIIVEDRVSKGEEINIAGLGTFGKSSVQGEAIAYVPDKEFAMELNEDFSSFSPVVLPHGLSEEELAATDTSLTDHTPDGESSQEPQCQMESACETESSLTEAQMPDLESDVPELHEEAVVTSLNEQPEEETTDSTAPVEPTGEESAPVDSETVSPAEDEPEQQTAIPVTVDLSTAEKTEEAPEATADAKTDCLVEEAEEYVIVRKKKNYFWLGIFIGLILGFALGLMALFAYLVQNMKISIEDLIY
ncbi:MAG: HU family DNA-binding protein [Paramuribaculum sp.]|nr:HU family DNA-binding protein [Paramuribaculum sp.]